MKGCKSVTGLSEMDREVMKEDREDEEWSRLVSNDVQERRANDVCKVEKLSIKINLFLLRIEIS